MKYFALCILLLSACIKYPNPTKTWRGKVLKNNKLVFVENVSDLPVKEGDTVTIYYDSKIDGYYISNDPNEACDMATFDRDFFSSDTTKFRFEAWNVRLEEQVYK